jgi:kynurenine formamidase
MPGVFAATAWAFGRDRPAALWFISRPRNCELGGSMKRQPAGVSALVLIGVISLAATLTRGAAPQANPSRPLVTQAQFEQWKIKLSNWGRWGKDDEMGALNLITPAKRKAAAALVKEGFAVGLASILSTGKEIDVPCPVEWGMLTASEAGATDSIGYPCIHGAGATHLDSFAHRFFDGKMWNGYPVSELVTKEGGAAKNSILTMKDGIVTRGVLYDIARLKGVPYLEPGTRIFPEDLEAWEKKTGAKAGAGDALLLRWGRWERRAKLGPWAIDEGSAGLDVSVIPWLKQRDIAVLGWETPGYAPQPAGDLPRLAVHDFALTMLGIHLLDRADFDALAEAAAARNRWEFLLTVAPLPIPNGTGSPVNPIAVF